jgi:hypothetical protein
MAEGGGFLLLALPDPCLLQVLQCCAADDHRGLFSAARAHTRLHQAAVVALHSISLRLSQQQQIDGVTGYLSKHGQHVNSLELRGHPVLSRWIQLRQLPPQVQLSSLQLERLCLQLQPGNGFQGVLGAAATVAALMQLELSDCELLGSGASQALAAALTQLPAGLEHLTVRELFIRGHMVSFPAGVLQQLPHLTYLELGEVNIAGVDDTSPVLQPLQALTRLVGLKLTCLEEVAVTSSMLSGMQQLTYLEMDEGEQLEPGCLAGKVKLQHLCLSDCSIDGGGAGVAQLLSHLQPLQQLTQLTLDSSLQAVEGSNPPASAYAALTASSKLQHLDISGCTLPAGVWQHLFPTGKQLPHLQSLSITGAKQASGAYAQAPESSRLVSCCPGLDCLLMGLLQGSADLLAALTGLSRLQTLRCGWDEGTAEVVQAVYQLTGLRQLDVWGSALIWEEGSLLQLTQLKQLTSWQYCGPSGHHMYFSGGLDTFNLWCCSSVMSGRHLLTS